MFWNRYEKLDVNLCAININFFFNKFQFTVKIKSKKTDQEQNGESFLMFKIELWYSIFAFCTKIFLHVNKNK